MIFISTFREESKLKPEKPYHFVVVSSASLDFFVELLSKFNFQTILHQSAEFLEFSFDGC